MSELDTCALCPRLCRSACPVATGSGREAAVPTAIAGVLLDHHRGLASRDEAVGAATLCVDCGACEHHCHLHRPLPALLRAARAELLPPPPTERLAPLTGTGPWVVVECDDRPLARWLEARLGQPVRRWPTTDRLGVASIEHPTFAARAEELRTVTAGLSVVVADGGAATALRAAGVGYRWLHEVLPELAVDGDTGSCVAGGPMGLACCGGAGPLAAHHPDEAKRTARLWAERGEVRVVADARCRAHLAAAGVAVTDRADRLKGETP